MGSIMRRKSQNGKVAYTARVRRSGEPYLTATFYRKADALKWIEQEEVAIQRRRHLTSETKRKRAAQTLSKLWKNLGD